MARLLQGKCLLSNRERWPRHDVVSVAQHSSYGCKEDAQPAPFRVPCSDSPASRPCRPSSADTSLSFAFGVVQALKVGNQTHCASNSL